MYPFFGGGGGTEPSNGISHDGRQKPKNDISVAWQFVLVKKVAFPIFLSYSWILCL